MLKIRHAEKFGIKNWKYTQELIASIEKNRYGIFANKHKDDVHHFTLDNPDQTKARQHIFIITKVGLDTNKIWDFAFAQSEIINDVENAVGKLPLVTYMATEYEDIYCIVIAPFAQFFPLSNN